VIRQPWRDDVLGAIQYLVGTLEFADPIDVACKALPAIRGLAPAISPQERELLRGVLVSFGLKLLSYSHLEMENISCTCVTKSTATLSKYANLHSSDPRDAFAEWLQTHWESMASVHPPTPEQRAAAVLRRTCRGPISLGRLSRECRCSISILRVRFRRRHGMTFRDYLHLARVVSIAHDLRQRGTRMDLLLRTHGYRSKKDFYRVFRLTMRITPRAFKQLPHAQADSCLFALRVRLVRGQHPIKEARSQPSERSRFIDP